MSTLTKALVASIHVEQQGLLGTRRAAHLLRRTSFHFSKERVEELAVLTAAQAVDLLFDTASPTPYMPRPLFTNSPSELIQDWIDDNNQTGDETRKRRAVTTWWLRNAIHDTTAHHKCAFFLHTTFTIGHEGLSITGMGQNLTQDVSRYLYDHVRLLNWLTQTSSNLKVAARKITLDNLMLGYLNNRQNINNGVDDSGFNENYAREFMELFTIGRGAQVAPGEYENYTEADISIVAKVFSGFTTANRRNSSPIDPDTNIPSGVADPALHLLGPHQFSNKFPNNPFNPVTGVDMDEELDNYIEMIFYQPATALNYANKIYRFFVALEIDTAAAQELADDLTNNDYDYVETLKILFKSEHFYSICSPNPDENNGNIIKSPIEMMTEAFSYFQSDLPSFNNFNNPTQQEVYDHFRVFATNYLNNSFGENSGIKIFAPPSVAGYPAYYQEPNLDKNWYTPGTISTRFGLGQKLVVDWNLSPNIRTNIDTVAYADYLANQGINVSDADELLDETLNLFPQQVSADRRDLILQIFLLNLSPINWYFEWLNYQNTGNDTGIRPHLNALVVSLMSAHEFQLK